MYCDKQTLYDLGILARNPDQDSIFKIFDQCVTSGGSSRLYEIFKSPLDRVDTIQERQKILRYVGGLSSDPSLYLDRTLTDEAEGYLKLNVIPFPHRSLLSFSVEYFSYRRFLHSIRIGAEALLGLVKKLHPMIQLFATPPESIQPLLKDILDGISVVQKNLKPGLWAYNLLKSDFILREKNKEVLEKMLQAVYELDAFLTLSSSVRKHGLSLPTFVESDQPVLEIKDMTHLHLQEPVANSVSIKKNNFLFLTGPNMAGKTTFLKSTGVAVYLAHLGLGVPAVSMRLTVLDLLFSSINTEDNIVKGYSYYYSEVMRVKEIASLLKKGLKGFIIFDELFRGTNIHDAYEASALIIKGFQAWSGYLFFLSTHLVELSEEFMGRQGFSFQCFEASLEGNMASFDYLLRPGVSNTRIGVNILKQEGIEELLYSHNN